MKEYFLKQRAFSPSARYRVLDDQENQVYHCKARFFSPSRKFDLYNTETGEHLYQIKRKLFSFRRAYRLSNGDGKIVAKARRVHAFLKKRVGIESDFGAYEIEGSFWAHDFQVRRGEEEMASIRKKRLSFGDAYNITINDEENHEFYLALLIMIDSKFHQRRSRSNRH